MTVCTVDALAAHKCLKAAFLRKLGLHDLQDGVGIPYLGADGKQAAIRVRRNVEQATPMFWREHVRPLAYCGPRTLERARERGSLVIAEGESDCWTLWAHHIPAIGIPGSSMTKYMEPRHIAGIPSILVIREPDEAGRVFVSGLAARLHELAFTGELRAVDLQAACGAKDPSDLHVRDPGAFAAEWQRAIEAAECVPLNESARQEESPPAPEAIADVAWDDVNLWPQLDDAALHGLAGDVVRALAPHTEADAAALLFSFLAGFGNAIGRDPHICVGAVRHRANLSVAIVGATAKSRKGQSWGEIKSVLGQADPDWLEAALLSGLSTGEGLIAKLRDRDDDEGVVVEKRALVVEPELARLLIVATRKDATISAIVREAWDGSTLRVLTRKDPLVAKDAHISIIGHITREELEATLTSTQLANGFANRFLFVCATRSKKLPSGGALSFDAVVVLGQRIRNSLERSRHTGQLHRTAAAEKLWAELYNDFPDEAGLAGAIVARADPQTLRLSLVYALLDGADAIDVPHLEAANAAWRYAEDSARHIFGSQLGDEILQQLIDGLREAWPSGLNATEQHKLFSRNVSAQRLKAARQTLESRGLVRTQRRRTGKPGGPEILSFAVPPAAKRTNLNEPLGPSAPPLESIRINSLVSEQNSGEATQLDQEAVDDDAKPPLESIRINSSVSEQKRSDGIDGQTGTFRFPVKP